MGDFIYRDYGQFTSMIDDPGLEEFYPRPVTDYSISRSFVPDDEIKANLGELIPSLKNGVAATISIWDVGFESAEGTSRIAPTYTPTGDVFQKFLVTGMDMQQMERNMILPTFGDDPDFLMTFGEEVHMWQIQGILRNSANEGAWAKEMDLFYRLKLRATLMAKRNQVAVLRIGDMTIRGYFLSLRVGQRSQNDDGWVDFAMQMYVRDWTYASASEANQYQDAGTFSNRRESATTYISEEGDTPQIVADKFGITAGNVQAANNLTDGVIPTGTPLYIVPQTSTPSTEQGLTPRQTYTAVEGDTLASVGARLGVTVASILELNAQYSSPTSEVSAGDVIIIPSLPPEIPPAEEPEP